MKIRKAVYKDAAAIAAVHVASWQRAYRNVMPADFLDHLSVSRREEMWRRWFEDEAGDVLVSESAGRVTGFITYGKTRDDDAAPDQTAEIYAIYMAPDYWGRGHGSALMAAALAALRREGFGQLTLWVLAENRRAISFYESKGFRADGGHKMERMRNGIILNELRFRMDLVGTSRA